MRVLVNTMLLLPFLGILFWMASCSNQTKTVVEQPTSSDSLHQAWDEIYKDVSVPRHRYNPKRDYEVEHLNTALYEYGITAFRINPNNPEHQRRYKRHLSGNLNPVINIEEDI